MIWSANKTSAIIGIVFGAAIILLAIKYIGIISTFGVIAIGMAGVELIYFHYTRYKKYKDDETQQDS